MNTSSSFGISNKLEMVCIGTYEYPFNIKVFNYKTRDLLGELKGHTDCLLLNPFVFLDDDQKLISASSDGTIKRWNLNNF